MKKIFTLMVIAIAMVAMPAQAQFGFGLRGGLNMTNLDVDGVDENDLSSSNKEGFFVGPTIKFTVPVIGIGLDASVMYDQRKMKFADGIDATTGEKTYTTLRDENIVLPVNLRYTFGLGDMAGVFVKAGPQWSWNIGGKNYFGDTFKFKKSSMSINLGAGAVLMDNIEIFVNYNINLSKSGEYEIKTLDENNNPVTKTGKLRSNAWQFGLAYYF
jgi:hypothetical protein